MKVSAIIVILLSVVLPESNNQIEGRFEGQSLLVECLEEVPVSYSTKDKEPFLEAVNRLEGVELVLVNAKKRKSPTYQFYYFQKTKSIDGETAYLTSPEYYRGETTRKSVLYLDYKEGKHFFYRADCFRKKLKESEELQKVLQRE